VVKRTQTNTNPDYPSTTICDYDYHFDLDGYPTQIIMKENNQVESKLILTYY
jgi:hypothetical protein